MTDDNHTPQPSYNHRTPDPELWAEHDKTEMPPDPLTAAQRRFELAGNRLKEIEDAVPSGIRLVTKRAEVELVLAYCDLLRLEAAELARRKVVVCNEDWNNGHDGSPREDRP